jgi:hypothetical protein
MATKEIDIIKKRASTLSAPEKRQLIEFLKRDIRNGDKGDLSQRVVSPEQWVESLRVWAREERNLPDLSSESLRRENIYEDRI